MRCGGRLQIASRGAGTLDLVEIAARIARGQVTGISDDSRSVRPGMVFVAVRGASFDGHDFAAEATAAGAQAIVAERDVGPVGADVCVVKDSRRALGYLLQTLHGHPSQALHVYGVTGTNGKTTVSHLLHHALTRLGRRAGLIGTVEIRLHRQRRPPSLTTPPAGVLAPLLAEMVAAGVQDVAMEVSSHALTQRRVEGMAFDGAIFTNLTRDHLDVHGSFEAYAAAKAELFSMLTTTALKQPFALLNRDDPRWTQMKSVAQVPTFTYGLKEGAEITLVATDRGCVARAFGKEAAVAVELPGMHNRSNLLAAIGALVLAGYPLEAATQALRNFPPVPGRAELVRAGQPFTVLVDFAHNPDGLRACLETARQRTPAGRLICVFGAEGSRDTGKRPEMGAVVGRLADLAIVTSDNPRGEDEDTIIDAIVTGLKGEGARYEISPEREAAIARAFALAKPGDTVVIAGKGPETKQVFHHHERLFCDKDVAERLLHAAGFERPQASP